MPTYVALLRGINVGGKNLIRMPALKAAFEDDGFEDVATYIQSGNVVFAAPATRATELTHRIETMLAEAFDYVPTVVVRSQQAVARDRRRRAEGVRRPSPRSTGTT